MVKYIMKRKIVFFLITVVCHLIALSANAEELKLYRIDDDNEGFKSFQSIHPDVQCSWSEQDYSTIYDLNSALLTGEFDSDVFNLDSLFFDCRQIMKKGYCVDLTGSETIRNELAKMHPSIVSQIMQDDKIFAVPFDISFSFWTVNMEAWTAAGLSDADVPRSFPELLDFLASWVERIEDEPEPEISINNRWVETLYNEYSYTSWLTQILMENYILQLQYAGQPLRFHNDELITLLERVKEIGAAIYRCEPVTKGKMQLFDEVASKRWPKTLDSGIVSMRINDSQPHLIKSYLTMYAINPGTNKVDLAIDLLERIILNIPAMNRSLMYRDAEPVLNPNYESDYTKTLANIARTEEALKSSDLDADAIEKLESDLLSYQNVLEGIEYNKYNMSPEQLQHYQSYVKTLYFPEPNIFFIATDTGWTMKQRQDRFATGLMSSQEFVKEMDYLAKMIEMENDW